MGRSYGYDNSTYPVRNKCRSHWRTQTVSYLNCDWYNRLPSYSTKFYFKTWFYYFLKHSHLSKSTICEIRNLYWWLLWIHHRIPTPRKQHIISQWNIHTSQIKYCIINFTSKMYSTRYVKDVWRVCLHPPILFVIYEYISTLNTITCFSICRTPARNNLTTILVLFFGYTQRLCFALSISVVSLYVLSCTHQNLCDLLTIYSDISTNIDGDSSGMHNSALPDWLSNSLFRCMGWRVIAASIGRPAPLRPNPNAAAWV